MTITELIKVLEAMKTQHGDLRVLTQSISHTWPPDLAVRQCGAEKVLVLND